MAGRREEPSLQLPSWDEFEPADQLDIVDGNLADSVDSPHHHPEDAIQEPSSSNFSLPITEASSSSAVRLPSQSSARIPSSSFGPTFPSHSSSSISSVIGPALPPGFAHEDESEEDPEDPDDPDDPSGSSVAVSGSEGGLSLPVIGPSLPEAEIRSVRRSHDKLHNGACGNSCECEPSSSSLLLPPPEPSGSRPARIIGPTIPSDLLPFEANGGQSDGDDEEADEEYGPAPPPKANEGGEMEMPVDEEGEERRREEGDDDDIVGPVPARADDEAVQAEYAARKAALLAAAEANSQKSKREEWMLELPKKLTNYGLGARQFSRGAGAASQPDSSWTKAPNGSAGSSAADREEAASSSKTQAEAMAAQHRDQAQQAIADSLTKERSESLLDSHGRKRRAEVPANGDANGGERRPFDREKDMQVRGLRPQSSAELKERCGQLSSRFGNSNSQKFL